MNNAIYIAVDTETGGIGPDVSLLTAYIAILDQNMDIIDELDLAMRPDNGIYQCTGEALGINKINLVEHDKTAITLGKAGELFRALLMKHSPGGSIKLLPLGHNIAFDMEKLYQHVLNKKESQKYISYRCLDTGSTGNYLKACGIIPETVTGSLGSYVEHYGIPKGDFHTARGDVLMTIGVMKAMIAENKSHQEKM